MGTAAATPASDRHSRPASGGAPGEQAMNGAQALTITVEGWAFGHWEHDFRAALADAAGAVPGLQLGLVAAQGATAQGGRQGGRGGERAVEVRAPAAADPDRTLKLLTLVLAALSLAVGTAQLALRVQDAATRPAPAAIVCTIEGPDGARELRIEGSAAPSEALLRECLRETGAPQRIRVEPPPDGPA